LLILVTSAHGQIEVYHQTASVEIGTTRQFSAYVPLSPNTVVWSVNGIVGGNATVGTVSQTGLYTAPATAPMANVVALRATSTAYPTKFGEATVTITRKTPWVWSISPQITVGAFDVKINGSNLTPDAVAQLNGMPLTTIYLSPTSLQIKGNAPAAGTALLTVFLPAPGAITSQPLSITIATAQPKPVTVSVSPSSATVAPGASQAFTAIVTNATDPGVAWQVNNVTGGSAATGTITAAGVYTAPTTAQQVTIRAVSMADSTKSATATVTVQAPPFTITPTSATVLTGASQTFTASAAATWQVNNITGGNATVGTITTAGVYTAPSAPQTVTVRAVSTADATRSATATVTVQIPAFTITPTTVSVASGATQTFTASGPATWQVNGVTGGGAGIGTITAAGVYSAPAIATNVTVRAVSTLDATKSATAAVTVTGPAPLVSRITAARLLEQATFGPRPADIAKVQQIGVAPWIDEQLAQPEAAIPNAADTGALRSWVLYNYTHAPDQLRQRLAYALSQIVVVSLNKNIYPDEILPWMRILQRNAFGNYRQLLGEVSVSPSMGKYLDLANSVKPGNGSGANENYARELMQLFSIGLWQLNPDGTQKLDGSGQPIPAYTQQTIQQVALALTGWTYPGTNATGLNWESFTGDLQPRPSFHDTTAKSFLGCSLPANQTPQQDMDATIDCIFNHPNVPPFISLRLIRLLVKSNPSPAFVARIAGVFANNGAGMRGDLKAVVRAILLDPEARQDTATADSGRLREPILHFTTLVRNLNGSVSQANSFAYVFDNMAQSVLNPPSVFSWFSAMYRVPKSPLFGPEFQIYTTTDATLRANFFYQILTNGAGEITIDLSPFHAVAGNTAQLLDKVDEVFLHGRMPANVRQSISNAVTASYDNNQKVQTAVYLTILSGQYAVQH
jgi:uncharacterized protein (DUF1800 family)